jgi:hypothetical protein
MNEPNDAPVSRIDDHLNNEIVRIAEFFDPSSINKIVNKLTDYAETLTEGKLSGIVNFQFKLNSTQTNRIIDLLLLMQIITRIHNVSLKGSKDLAVEYVSNLFSDTENPENISSFLSLKNLIENRLAHQTQQYNINMGKTNTSLAMPVIELRGHVRIYKDLMKSSLSISTKAQHGIIAASLHDAYVRLINRDEWYNDRSYMKFFFNEDDLEKRNHLLLTNEPRLTLAEINRLLVDVINKFTELKSGRLGFSRDTAQVYSDRADDQPRIQPKNQQEFSDRMLMTPFGSRYGRSIDGIIDSVFLNQAPSYDEERVRRISSLLYDAFKNFSGSLNNDVYKNDVVELSEFLISSQLTMKTYFEKYILPGRRDPAVKSYSPSVKSGLEEFLHGIFYVYFEEAFERIFRIIKSLDVRKHACAYIMKRVYLRVGEAITPFGYFFITTVSRIGGIRS